MIPGSVLIVLNCYHVCSENEHVLNKNERIIEICSVDASYPLST